VREVIPIRLAEQRGKSDRTILDEPVREVNKKYLALANSGIVTCSRSALLELESWLIYHWLARDCPCKFIFGRMICP
jgi:hypothetical protein